MFLISGVCDTFPKACRYSGSTRSPQRRRQLKLVKYRHKHGDGGLRYEIVLLLNTVKLAWNSDVVPYATLIGYAVCLSRSVLEEEVTVRHT